MKKRYKCLGYILIILILLITIFIIDTSIESNNIDKEIEEFKSRAVFVETINNFNYFKVIKKYDYEDCSNICNNHTDLNVGTIGDIYISNRDPLGDFFITEWISKIAWIGHAGVVYNEDATKMVEIVGNDTKENNVVKIYENTWLSKDSLEYIVLRVKDINEKSKMSIVEESEKLLGHRYDYTFLFGGNKRFYCTNLVSYIYKKIGIKLNNDMLFTTGSDMITNENTYMIYYREKFIKDNKVYYNIYYLDEA